MKIPTKLSRKHLMILAVALLGVLGMIAGVVFFFNNDQPVYEYIRVEKKPMRVTLRETGTVGPEHRLNVTPPINGRIEELKVVNGQVVKRGDVLALMSSTDRATLIDAALKAGSQELEFWQNVYKPSLLLAPVDGRIINTVVVPGQVVVAAQAVFIMSDHLIVQANVDETDLHQVVLGQPVEITFDSFPDSHLTGKVHEIAFDATTVNNVTTYVVSIYLDDTPDYVRSGVSANVFLVLSDRPDVLQIPTDAMTPEQEVLVVTGQGQPPVLQKIKPGVTDGVATEVLAGLQEGDWIARRTFAVKKAKKGFSLVNF